jgi:hypothetical protein
MSSSEEGLVVLATLGESVRGLRFWARTKDAPRASYRYQYLRSARNV